MKTAFIYIVFLGIPIFVFSQSSTIDTTIKLDILKSPASPAFNILGISPSAIERPTDVTTFALSLQNATNNFTTIPNSYALEIAPFLLSKRKFSLNEFDDNTYSFKQSFSISAGFTHMGPEGKEDIDSLKTTKIGFGIKFSIIRPRWSSATRQAYAALISAQKELLQDYKNLEKQNENHKVLLEKRIERREIEKKDTLTDNDKKRIEELKKEMNDLEEQINDDINAKFSSSSDAFEKTKNAATSFKTERRGIFLDFDGGIAFDFPDNRFNNSNVYKAGVWLTGGNESGNSGITSMFILRYLYQPDAIFADDNGTLNTDNVSTFDAGARFLLNALQSKFVLSGEALYRSVIGSSQLDPSWRLIVNAEYDIGVNQKITFSFGRNFDGSISKGGNLIAALNFIAGFGSERKIIK